MTRYISPVYVYQCRECATVFHLDYAPGFGGPYCPDCMKQTCSIIDKDYENGTRITV